MTFTVSRVVDAPVDEVFGWHAMPGAIARLTPSWMPVRVAAEAASLRDGRAELAFPGGLRWIAEHDPAAYDPPRRFADMLAAMTWDGAPSLAALQWRALPWRALPWRALPWSALPGRVAVPSRAVLPWRHTHHFAAVSAGSALVTDHVDTPLPAGLLRPMFRYRHDQLAGDLAAHLRARELCGKTLTVAMTGSSGLIGSALTALLTTGGHRVIRLVRRASSGADERQWHPGRPDPELLRGVDAVVHLAGAPIGRRFTKDHKRAVWESRILPTRRLAELAGSTEDGPSVLVASSAIGYYGPSRGDELLTEDSPRGGGFLAGVAADWEAATTPASRAGVRVVQVRTGVVQSPRGGTLRLLRPLVLAGAGGRLGSGRQWLSWIGIDDLVDIYYRALVDGSLAGPVNATAPDPVRNAWYSRTLARVLRRPLQLPVPGSGPGVLLGAEGASELALADQRVSPQRLIDAGHPFRHPELEPALRHLLGRAI